jgi:hypothetical protein
METLLKKAALSALALILLSGGMLFAQESEVATIRKRLEETQSLEAETLRDILSLTAGIKASASPKDIKEADVIKLEERLGEAVHVETRSFAHYNDPVGLLRRPVPADEKTVTKKITDLLESAREDSQKAVKFYREKKYDPAMKEVKDVEKKLEGLQLQFDARSKARAKRLEEKAKIEEMEKAKAEEKERAKPKPSCPKEGKPKS